MRVSATYLVLGLAGIAAAAPLTARGGKQALTFIVIFTS